MGLMKSLLIEREESARLAHDNALDQEYSEYLSSLESMEHERHGRPAMTETIRQREARERREVVGWPPNGAMTSDEDFTPAPL